MENNEEFVTNVTENVEEQTTEEIVEESIATEESDNKQSEEKIEEAKGKFYTDEEIDLLVQKKINRKEKKLQKEYEKKMSPYLEAENIINQGLGTSNIIEASSKLKDYYEEKGISIQEYKPSYSDNDIETLAASDANLIIESGIDEVIEEVDRLAELGSEKMTPREKKVFSVLANYRNEYEQKQELKEIGINEDLINDKDFKEFSNKLNPSLSLKEKYEMYNKYKPKPKVEQMGSMKNKTAESEIKDFYSKEEAMKFTKADFDKNPKLFAAVEKSMTQWK